MNLIQALEEGGIGVVLGAITGFLAKMFTKLILIGVGIFLGLLRFLQAEGIITVNWGDLFTKAQGAGSSAVGLAGQAWGVVLSVVAVIPIGAGFLAGAALGWKVG